jgi:signal transduction histidine kinase
VEVEVRTGAFFHRGREYVVALVRDLGWRRRLERETLRVGERERLLLGKELHDGLGQHLTGVAFMAKTLARKLAGAHAREAEDVEAIGRLVKDAVGQIRVLSKGLELSEYEGQELPQALEEMSSVVGRLMGVSMELDLDPGLKNGDMKLDRGQATQLYRVCHDVVSDAVRNRMAQKVRIQIRKVEEGVLLSVQHDGAVQAQEAVGDRSLLSFRLRYRARLLDASLEMSQNPEGVTTVLCSVRVNGEQG